MTSAWKDIKTAPINRKILLLDPDGNIRIGIQPYEGIFRSNLDFGDVFVSVYYTRKNFPVKWADIPKLDKEELPTND